MKNKKTPRTLPLHEKISVIVVVSVLMITSLLFSAQGLFGAIPGLRGALRTGGPDRPLAGQPPKPGTPDSTLKGACLNLDPAYQATIPDGNEFMEYYMLPPDDHSNPHMKWAPKYIDNQPWQYLSWTDPAKWVWYEWEKYLPNADPMEWMNRDGEPWETWGQKFVYKAPVGNVIPQNGSRLYSTGYSYRASQVLFPGSANMGDTLLHPGDEQKYRAIWLEDHMPVDRTPFVTGLRLGDNVHYWAGMRNGHASETYPYYGMPVAGAAICSNFIIVLKFDPNFVSVDKVGGGNVAWVLPDQIAFYVHRPIDSGGGHENTLTQVAEVQAHLLSDPGDTEYRLFEPHVFNRGLHFQPPSTTDGNVPFEAWKHVEDKGMLFSLQKAPTIFANETNPKGIAPASNFLTSAQMIEQLKAYLTRHNISLSGYQLMVGRGTGPGGSPHNGFIVDPYTQKTYLLNNQYGNMFDQAGQRQQVTQFNLGVPLERIIDQQDWTKRYAQGIIGAAFSGRLWAFFTEATPSWPQATGFDFSKTQAPEFFIKNPEVGMGGGSLCADRSLPTLTGGINPAGVLMSKGGASFKLDQLVAPIIDQLLPSLTGYTLWKDGLSRNNAAFTFQMSGFDARADEPLNGPAKRIADKLEAENTACGVQMVNLP